MVSFSFREVAGKVIGRGKRKSRKRLLGNYHGWLKLTMIRYYYYLLKKRVSPDEARLFFNTSNCSLRKKNKILSKTDIKTSSQTTIVAPFYFEFGNINFIGDVLINNGCNFLDNEMITIKTGTMIGPNVTLTTVSHHTEPTLRHAANIIAPINIGENVWIGAGVIVLPGISIGDNSVIAANSVVTADVAANCLYAGTPAKFKKFL
ncbi:DapH/DapD/GlmU-related protein [Erwinia amylovora]|uniref:DapH/DapD/GlmU-related protein n=1 Tax=Erwinia amylovora TaxID=552 RepID=UPI001CBB1B31|nr:DapH/DapD/GlmU-related protein [Erwinia amylovora]MBZ2399196.1 acetyltransferase [Erwinia amylovora]